MKNFFWLRTSQTLILSDKRQNNPAGICHFLRAVLLLQESAFHRMAVRFMYWCRKHICIAALDKDNVMHWETPIKLPKSGNRKLPVPGGLILNENGTRIYVTLSRNNSLAIINLSDKSIVEIPVGVAPYDVYMLRRQKFMSVIGVAANRKRENQHIIHQAAGCL